MNFGGFLLFNALCDVVNNVGKNSNVPPRGTKAYRNAVIGGTCAAVLIIIAVIVILLDVFD